MIFWRQLRWRIVAVNMLVVVVGVVMVLLATAAITSFSLPQALSRTAAEALAGSDLDQGQRAAMLAAAAEIASALRGSILVAVGFAAVCALLAGLAGSLLLAREILRPLQQLAHSSRRIAGGHYDERMAITGSDELAQVAESFNQMAEALDQVERTRVTLIGDVSHELRTPLTGLSGYIEGLMDGLFADTDETLALMYGEVRRMRRLVDDLQTLSRVEAGQISLHLENIDLVELTRQAMAKFGLQWQSQNISVDLQEPPHLVQVHADADRVEQVLLNLLSNALIHTPEGGQVLVTVVRDGRFARVDVRDSGIGIDAEQLPYLFERFYRADRSRARASGGSGIGLTISRHLAWAMGGDLTAASAGPGQGSTFSLFLPLI